MNNQSFKSAVLARINSMGSEKLFLEKILRDLETQIMLIQKRIKSINNQILVEKESCEDIKD